MTVSKAVIVAAGLGSRLGSLTESIPKCMLKLNDKTIIEYAINNLKKYGINNIALVVGYKKNKLKEYLGSGYTYIENPFYKYTNNMASLWLAKEFIGDDDFLYCHSDIVYDENILKRLLDNNGEIVLSLENKICDEEAMKVKVDSKLNFLDSSKEIPISESIGEWIGLAKFKNRAWKKYLNEIEILLKTKEFMAYDTKAMNFLVKKNFGIIKIDSFIKLPWIEVDYKEDYIKAQNMFSEKLGGINYE